MAIKFLGIEIERKTDILALAAFIISISGLLYQITVFLQGPRVHLISPEQITLTTYSYGNDSNKYVSIIANMTYVNSGQEGHNAVIQKEKVSFEIGSQTYEFAWQKFVDVTSEENRLDIKFIKSANPFSLSAGSAESHETQFFPRSRSHSDKTQGASDKNFLPLNTFVRGFESLLLSGQSQKQEKLKLRFTVEMVNDKRQEVTCIVYLTREDLWRLQSLKKGWIAPSCWPEKCVP
ncbi:MAG: hypothetical protein B6D35_03305 [Candidatus Brocadia sp. UTAMX2]|jgi:hypothetical protein|nr:MAG: hypothetical protein B6D35_03305 [Candidatus Brocadia sp. UTAMX2]